MSPTATLLTHGRPAQTSAALVELFEVAARAGVQLRLDQNETRKHAAALSGHSAVLTDVPLSADVDLCVVLGGDGTILRALRAYVGTGVPVFAVNFGEVGFLATIESDQLPGGLEQALAGEYDLLPLPAIELGGRDGVQVAINDVSVHRRMGDRVAEIAYGLDGEEVGSVRCDGLVVATPAGSTGYNLANGGPLMAWGVHGLAVSFIAPHSLTARALVVAPSDVVTVYNRSRDPLHVSLDGRPAHDLDRGASLEVRLREGASMLAQMPGSSFYRRLRDKFGRLAR